MTSEPVPHSNKVQEEIPLRTSQFHLFRDLVYRTTGISLADNKLEFVQSRLRKRLRHHNLTSYQDYYDYLESSDPDGSELQQMINRITTNKTSFFREEHHFDYLSNVVFPRFIKDAEQGRREKKLRIWCAAASTGEEPYSLAMTVRDTFAERPDWDVRILASDIDTDVLDRARAAVYRSDLTETLPQETLKKHFFRGKGASSDKVMVRPEVADLVTFRQINLLDPEWPIRGPFDVIFCRNVLIYFDHETHDRLMRRMSRYLASNGSLFIGHSESLSRLTDTYTRVGKTVYQRADAAASQRQDEDPSAGYTGGLSARGSNTEAHGDVTLRSDPGTGLKSRTGTGGSYTQTSGPSGISQRATSASATGMNQPKVDECSRTSIIVGGVAASDKPSEIDTVLGSCIAACLYDDDAHIGGMNHFALPGGDNNSRAAASYGVHAMELLINSIMQLGGDRRRLKAKVFGGATVLNSASGGSIGNRNAEFIRDFLSTESIPLEAEYLGGDCGMKLRFETHTGRARVKLLSRDDAVAADQRSQESPPEVTHETPGDVTLF